MSKDSPQTRTNAESSAGALSQAGARRASVWKKLLVLLLVGLPLGLVVGELALRGLMAAKDRAYDGEQLRAEFVELRSRVTDSLPRPGDDQELEVKREERTKIIHPFVAFDDLGTHNQFLRDKQQRNARDPEVYRIVVLGGSVAGLFSLQGTKQLRSLLKDEPALEGRRIEFMGYARGGHKQPQQLIRLSQLLVSGIRADAVLNLDGFNEVAIGNKNRSTGMDPTYPSYNHWMRFARALGESAEQEERFSRADRAKWDLVDAIDARLEQGHFASAIWGTWARRKVDGARRNYEGLRDEYMAALEEGGVAEGVLGPAFEGGAEEALEECVALWMESSRQIQMLCDQYDMDYLHVLQPTLHDVGAKPMTSKEIEKGKINRYWLEGVTLGYPKLREGGQQLAAEGIEFFDATGVFAEVEETLYYDSCHFNKRGNELLAERLVPLFAGLLAD